MDLLVNHRQVKKERKTNLEYVCEMRLYETSEDIHFYSEFSFDYKRFGKLKKILISHGFSLKLKNGNFNIVYQLVNESLGEEMIKNKSKRGDNRFDYLLDLTENGCLKGEKRTNYWGVKYKRACDDVVRYLVSRLTPLIESEHLKDKDYINKTNLNSFYDLIVDFHLDKKKIKGHDGVYYSLLHDYPKTKWLKENEYKFIPAVLDSYGIKTKYLIGEINKAQDKDVNIRTLSYICRLFGDNYIDYLKQINWMEHCCGINVSNNRYHTLKNESEKKSLVSLFNNWEKSGLQSNSLVHSLNEVLTIRDFLLNKNMEVKFNAKDDDSFELMFKKWESLKNYFKKGYRVRVSHSGDFVKQIEEPIIIDDEKFEIRILKTEDDFITEGYNMKNCMSKQFVTALSYVYLSMTHNKKTINLQYRKGKLSQSYGKANTPVDKLFNKSIEILNKRMENFQNLEIKKEKFDFI